MVSRFSLTNYKEILKKISKILTILAPIFEKGGPWAQKSKFGSQTNYFWYMCSKWIFMNRSKRKSRKFWILGILDPIFENGGPWAQKPQFWSQTIFLFLYVAGPMWLVINRWKWTSRKFGILETLDPILENGGPWAQ